MSEAGSKDGERYSSSSSGDAMSGRQLLSFLRYGQIIPFMIERSVILTGVECYGKANVT